MFQSVLVVTEDWLTSQEHVNHIIEKNLEQVSPLLRTPLIKQEVVSQRFEMWVNTRTRRWPGSWFWDHDPPEVAGVGRTSAMAEELTIPCTGTVVARGGGHRLAGHGTDDRGQARDLGGCRWLARVRRNPQNTAAVA